MTGDRPVLIYDGRCSFCGIWVRYWQRLTGERVSYAPSQEVSAQFPEISQSEFQRAVWLVYPDGRRASGARAAYELMAHAAGKSWPLWLYSNVPGLDSISEGAYRFIAGHRNFFYQVTRIFWGKEIHPASYRLTRSLFLKGVAAVFLIAFLSMMPQVSGLIGSNGISPAHEYLNAIRDQTGVERYWLLPTLAWIDSSDAFLRGICWTGSGLAVAVLVGIAPLAALFGMFVLYLSLVSVGQDFLSFQWDVLLLEVGFAAMLLAPRALLPWKARPAGAVGIWVMRLLVFRLMLESGLVKLLSGDPSWRSLTALNFHYQTQPLPTPLAWYANQLPGWFQKFSTAGVFAVELMVPFLFLMPRRLRIIGAWITIVFQLLIAATGNYTFFNLLTIVLCVALFDDRHLGKFLPKKFRAADSEVSTSRRVAILPGALLIVIGMMQLAGMMGAPVSLAMEPAEILHIVNGYGLFAIMTTSRPEILIEGSNDGQDWQEYQFKYKPGDVRQPPRWVAPYQPRLDWQMWFAALGRSQDAPWFSRLMERLLEGSPEVLALLAKNPFPDKPPRFVRAKVYDYRFSDAATRRSTGDWWSRTYTGSYFPEVSLPH